MLVTCYADASFHSRGASWGVWIRSDAGRIVRAGRCPGYVSDSTEAELAAVFAAMFLATRRWDEAKLLLVRSDCQAALALAEGRAKAKRPGGQRLQSKIDELLKGGIGLRCSWVRGHQRPSNSVSAYLNNRCDEMARRARVI